MNPPLTLLIQCVCDAAKVSHTSILIGRGRAACLARAALIWLFIDRGMSQREAVRKAGCGGTVYHDIERRMARPDVQRMIREAKWQIEQRWRPVGDDRYWRSHRDALV